MEVRNFEADLELLFNDKIKNDDSFCKRLYSSITNIRWINKGIVFDCSFRYAGAIIADIRGSGNYMDWYLDGETASIDDEIYSELNKLGWKYEVLV